MSDWKSGYVSDIEYTAGFYRELAPNFLNLACIMHGYDVPDIKSPFTYCELGCGQALSTMLMAATYPHAQFYAFDFNPTHIASAEKLARDAGLENIHFYDCSFEEIAMGKKNLPAFDYIVFHGIYSWVNEENRNYLQSICRSHLRAGGIVYNSYNAQPGWSSHAPLQHLLRELANMQVGASDQRMNNALAKLNEFVKTDPALFKAVPGLKDHLNRLNTMSANYLVHEYLHDSWKAFYASEVLGDMAAAKLTYVGQANPIDAYPALTLSEKSRQFINQLPTEELKQDFKDTALNNQFRKDIYVRGPVKLVGEQQRKKLCEMKFQLTEQAQNIKFTFKTPLGEVMGKPEAYNQIIDYLKGREASLLDVEKNTNLSFIDVVQSCMLLLSNSSLHPSLDKDVKASKLANNLNAVLAKRAEDQDTHHYLAAPMIGSAVTATYLDRLLLNAYNCEGIREVDKLVDYALSSLQARNLTLNKEGKALSGVEEVRVEMTERAVSWQKNLLPLWKELGVV